MNVRMDDGSEGETGLGDVMIIPPGHDAWTVGDEPCVVFDFSARSPSPQSSGWHPAAAAANRSRRDERQQGGGNATPAAVGRCGLRALPRRARP
jgi:hypothetical protein